MLPLIVILGPTGVGKTDISIQLAKMYGGEIVSADSRLFYRGMDIGTAKPSHEERMAVPHHLIDITLPDRPMSLVAFQQAARAAIKDIHHRGKLPFLVGGTGQYVQAVVEEWIAPLLEPDPVLRGKLEKWGREIGAVELHRKLAILDPEAAERIEPHNLRRSVRALEVIYQSGARFSIQRKKGKPTYQIVRIGLIRPRSDLYKIIDDRIERMVKFGLLTEVQALLASGYPPDLPAFSAIGYREIVQVALNQLSLEEAIVLMKRATRQFIRRQANWFKLYDPNIHWFDLSQSGIEDISSFLHDALAS